MENLIIPSMLLVRDVIPLCEHLLDITQPLTEIDIKVKELHNKVTRIYERLVKKKTNPNKSLITKQLILLNKQREKALNTLRDKVLSIVLPGQMWSNALKLYSIINKYCPEGFKPGIKAETAMVNALLKAFAHSHNQKLLSDLNITSLYESLKITQEAFEAVSLQKSGAINLENASSDAANQMLNDLVPELITLETLIQHYYSLEPDKYGAIYHQMIDYITEVNSRAQERLTGKGIRSKFRSARVPITS